MDPSLAPIAAVSPTALTVPEGYLARRNLFNFWGIKCRIMTLDRRPLYFVHLKAFRFREDITIYRDESRTQPLLTIRAREIIDFSAMYDVYDVVSAERVGGLRRRGLRSLIRDEWELVDAAEQPIGLLQEDSTWLALLRRFLSGLIPQHYHITIQGQAAARITGTWNPFVVQHTMDLSPNRERYLDPRLALASSVLLMTIEGKQG